MKKPILQSKFSNPINVPSQSQQGSSVGNLDTRNMKCTWKHRGVRTARNNGKYTHKRGGFVPSDRKLFAGAAVRTRVASREPHPGRREVPEDSGSFVTEHLVLMPIGKKNEVFLEIMLREEAKNLEKKKSFIPILPQTRISQMNICTAQRCGKCYIRWL